MTRHLILCGGLAPSQGENGRKLELTITDKPGGIDLRIEQLRRQMVSDIPDTLTDLLEIAAYVYAADSQVSRGGRYMQRVGGRLAAPVQVRDPGPKSRVVVIASRPRRAGRNDRVPF